MERRASPRPVATEILRQYAAAAMLIALPLAGAHFTRPEIGSAPGKAEAKTDAPVKPPAVEPAELRAISPEDARRINAAIPFLQAPNPAARPFLFSGSEEDLDRALDCLAAAQYYEAGDDPEGQKAVAQVVLNRVRHPAFPKSVCGVVFQGAERQTGCQFTFTCDGALSRTPSAAAWDRARALARRMLAGLVDRKIGYATHYHTDWVVPYWSNSLDKISEVHTHLFFRWPGWWGTPRAFLRSVATTEEKVPLLARLSPAHAGTNPAEAALSGLIAPNMPASAADLAAAPKQVTPATSYVPLAGGARMVATSPERDAFVIQLPRDMATSQYVTIARTFCSGRARCRIMGWLAGDGPPGSFPIPPQSLSSMQFSYIHNSDSGLQRLLWNCAKVPQDDPRNCMRERVPVSSMSFPPVAPRP